MTPLARGWYWMLDYLYVGYWQVHAMVFPADASRYRTGSRVPVVLLPGIYETWQFMHPIARRLHDRGHPVHVVRSLGRNRRTVVDGARLVTEYLDANDLNAVILVAHSKGGLIGKYLMMSPDARERIDRLVAVASPFSGSSLARYTVLPSLRALAPTDPTIRLLVEEQFVNARITSVYGSFDPHIPDGSVLPGATNVELDAPGHFRIMGDVRLLDAVERACAD